MSETNIKHSVFAEKVTDHMLAIWLSWGTVMASYMDDYEEAEGTFRAIRGIAERFYELRDVPIDDKTKATIIKQFHDIRVEENLSTDSILDLEILV